MTRTLVALLLLAGRAQEPAGALAGLDAYVEEAMKAWKVPGLALAVVKDDRVVLLRGYGLRSADREERVDADTVFPLASASKAFTAAAAAVLVDEGKLAWDDPAVKHLPDLQLFDPVVTREITVRDLLSHRSGLPRGDYIWYGALRTRAEVLERVRHLKPVTGFRNRFGYQNIMYLAAGEVVGRAAGKSWEDFVRERIFAPLGMSSTSPGWAGAASRGNAASPHLEGGRTARRDIDPIGPAGSIHSTARDMVQWVRVQLGGGRAGEAKLWSPAVAAEMHFPQAVVRLEPPWSETVREANFLSYGLGWFLQDYRGKKVVQHGGNIDGFSTLVAMIPEERLGLVALTNLGQNRLAHSLMYRVFDQFLGPTGRDWSEELLASARHARAQAAADRARRERERARETAPSLALAAYAGTYRSDVYGEARVAEKEGALSISFNTFTADLSHWQRDQFMARWRGGALAEMPASFRVSPAGRAEEVQLELAAVTDLVFRRVPDAEPPPGPAPREEELRRFAGAYESKSPLFEARVEAAAGGLELRTPGREPVELLLDAGTRFRMKGMPDGHTAEFAVAGGEVVALTLAFGPRGPAVRLVPRR